MKHMTIWKARSTDSVCRPADQVYQDPDSTETIWVFLTPHLQESSHAFLSKWLLCGGRFFAHSALITKYKGKSSYLRLGFLLVLWIHWPETLFNFDIQITVSGALWPLPHCYLLDLNIVTVSFMRLIEFINS